MDNLYSRKRNKGILLVLRMTFFVTNSPCQWVIVSPTSHSFVGDLVVSKKSKLTKFCRVSTWTYFTQTQQLAEYRDSTNHYTTHKNSMLP